MEYPLLRLIGKSKTFPGGSEPHNQTVRFVPSGHPNARLGDMNVEIEANGEKIELSFRTLGDISQWIADEGNKALE